MIVSFGKIMATAAAMALLMGCSDDDKPPQDSAPSADVAVDSGTLDVETDIASPDGPPATAKKLIILHTNDIHEHLNGFAPNADYTPDTTGDDATRGGLARLATAIKAERQAAGNTPVLLLDDGDFTMGTIFTWLDTTEPPTMSLLQDMGYDAVTLGNHEFEWGPAATAAFINAAVKSGFKVPIVSSNMKLDSTNSADDGLETLVKDGVIVTKLVKTLSNGLKVGLFGIMGKDAADLARAGKPVTFDAAETVAQAMIKQLRDQDKVDLVICLSHSGTDENGKGEDADMASKAPGIDVIISGHTHKELAQPVKVGDTLIVQTGKYGRNLGKLELSVAGGKVASSTYKLIAIDDTIKGDAAVQQKIDGYVAKIDAMLAPAGLAYDKVIAETSFDLTFPYFSETLLGNLVTDAYLNAYNAIYSSEPADFAVEAGGFIRDDVLKGKTGQLWLADIFRAVPLGIGPDKQPGAPLVSLYLNGKDIKAAAELIPLAAGMLNSQVYFLQLAGMTVEYAKGGMPTASVQKVTIGGKTVDLTDTTTCYKGVTDLYVAEMMSLVAGATGGLLKIEGKESDCTTVITDMKSRVVDADPATAGVQELKVWQALVNYLGTFPDTDSDMVPDIPQSYATLQNRIVAK